MSVLLPVDKLIRGISWRREWFVTKVNRETERAEDHPGLCENVEY